MSKKSQSLKLFWLQIALIPQTTKNKGFTLTELLIAVFTAAIVISSLLTAMVQILQADRREARRSQIQEQTQSALNYISQDLKEAVYIYEGSSNDPNKRTIANIEPFLPNYSDRTPILAFWKTQSISDSQIPTEAFCNGLTKEEEQLECNNVRFQRNEYVLVVYYQLTKNSITWEGKSRIERYSLPRYSNPSNLTVSAGYVDPRDFDNNFATWPIDENGNNPQQERPSNNVVPPVLLDFVDDPNATISNQLTCPTNFSRTPPNGNSFYVCVRQAQSLSDKQNIIVYLRGNEQKRGENNFADTFRPVAQTQITIGGAIDKSIISQ